MRFIRHFAPAAIALLIYGSLPAPTGRVQAQAAGASPAATASAGERTQALDVLFAQYWDAYLEAHPEFASTIGDKRWNDKVTDYSVQAVNEWLEREQNWLMKLAVIDPEGLSDQEKLSRELLLRQFTEDQEGSEFKAWEMPVTQMGGIQTRYAQLAAELSFNSVKDYDDWIARLHAMPHAFAQVTTNMSIGVEDGRVPPKYLLEKVLEQVKAMAAEKPEETPFAQPLKKFPATVSAAEQTRIRTEMLDAIAKEVLPAYVRFARYLEVSYVPAGRSDPGIWALPDGAKYYQFLIRKTTTTNLTADQIHQIGVDEVKKDEAEEEAIAEKLGFKNLQAMRASMKTNPKMKPASADALLEAYRGYLGPMQAKLPELFGHIPKIPFEVVPVPDFMAKTAPTAYYQQGAPDGSRPGRLFIDTYNATDRDLDEVEATAYHEGIPGHHLQISTAQELTGLPQFRKYEHYTAYVEGWGLYAERLGKDAGFYQDPYSDYGRLEGDILRAIRLVVDTGVHSQHWTRQQMVDYFHAHSAIDETDVQAEVDRYIAWPSQALAYKVGQMKILELRARSKQELGDKFDMRAFHDEVLDAGALPLDLLEARVDAWIATERGAGQ
jgi:uncharacterized protein (DUF885 family)